MGEREYSVTYALRTGSEWALPHSLSESELRRVQSWLATGHERTLLIQWDDYEISLAREALASLTATPVGDE